jgi:hypothetical protein
MHLIGKSIENALSLLILDQNQKYSKSLNSTQGGFEWSKEPSHAIVPLR